MDRIKHILGDARSRESVNTNTHLKINLEGNERLLPPDEITKIVDAGEQFNKERQSSTFYRILGNINPLVSNVLFNINEQNSWSTFDETIFRGDTESETPYQDSIRTHLKEVDGWFGYYDPIKSKKALCNFYDMEPKRERFLLTPDTTNRMTKNWELTITYPASADTQHNMVKGGLLLVDWKKVLVGGRDMIAFATPVKHNLSVGKTVRLTGTTMDGDHEVVRLGLDNGDLKDYYFCIDSNPAFGAVGFASRMTRLVSGQPSQYYFRKFKKIKTRVSPTIEMDDYEIYNLAFSENIFTDSIVQFVFNEDIDVSGLVDNLKRPLSEIYLTIVKTSSNGIFSPVKSGIECPFIANLNTSNLIDYLRKVPVIQKIHNGGVAPVSSHVPLESSLTIAADAFYGDVAEWNTYEVKETILGEVYHRFNTVNREGFSGISAKGPRQEGYYYKAHQQIKIREFSNYLEQGDKFTSDMPDYKIDLGDGRFLWRDLLDIGINDVNKTTLNYPFVNGCHYMFQTLNFEVRRQDPFDLWDLYYGAFPADPIGNTMNNKFTVKLPKDVC